jgi:hypothetical protein
MVFQVPVKVKLELESSIVVLMMAALVKTASRRTTKECGSHIAGRGGRETVESTGAQSFSHSESLLKSEL